jgi:hypothetical protein
VRQRKAAQGSTRQARQHNAAGSARICYIVLYNAIQSALKCYVVLPMLFVAYAFLACCCNRILSAGFLTPSCAVARGGQECQEPRHVHTGKETTEETRGEARETSEARGERYDHTGKGQTGRFSLGCSRGPDLSCVPIPLPSPSLLTPFVSLVRVLLSLVYLSRINAHLSRTRFSFSDPGYTGSCLQS